MKHPLPSLLLAGAVAIALSACTSAAPAPSPTRSQEPKPASLGEVLRGNGWALTVDAIELDSTVSVAAANEFNPPAPEGQQYSTVTVTLERTDDSSQALDVAVSLVVAGEVLLPAAVVAPSQLHLLSEFPSGTPVTGAQAYLVPTGTRDADVVVDLGPGATYEVGGR